MPKRVAPARPVRRRRAARRITSQNSNTSNQTHLQLKINFSNLKEVTETHPSQVVSCPTPRSSDAHSLGHLKARFSKQRYTLASKHCPDPARSIEASSSLLQAVHVIS